MLAHEYSAGRLPLTRRSPWWLRSWNGTGTRDPVAGISFGTRRFVEIGLEGRVEPIDHVAKPDDQTDVDDLLSRKVFGKSAIGPVIDRFEARRFLSVSNNSGLRRRVESIREGIISKMTHLLFTESDAPTEHCVRGYSIVAIVDDRRCQVGKLGFLRREGGARAIDGTNQFGEGAACFWPICQSSVEVEHLAARFAALGKVFPAFFRKPGLALMQ